MATTKKKLRPGGRETAPDALVLTVPEAGKLLGLNRAAAYRAALRGELPTIRLGEKILRVSKSRLLRWIDEGQQPAA